MWKWLVAITLAFMGFQLPVAYAADRIEMKTKIPFADITSQDNLIRVHADITNNGDAVTGELRFSIEELNSKKMVLPYVKEITVQKGETKHVFFDLPSEEIINNSRTLQLEFYQGNQLLAKVTPNYQGREKQSDQVTVVVLDQHENSMQFLNQVRQEGAGDSNKEAEYANGANWKSMLVSNVIPEELPTEAHVLSNINMLVIGDISANSLPSDQINKIKEWVYAGGNLLVSAATPPEILDSFKEWMPALTKQPGTTKDLSTFTEISKKSALPVQQITVYNKSLPLFSTQKVGLGKLFFANYDVNAQPLASWDFNRQLWSKLVSQYELNSQVRFPYLNRNPNYYNLANHIPGIHVPSASVLFFIWIGYVLLIGPILYVLLKRRDRRDWAWGIIPVSALVVSVGALSFGKNLIAPSDKLYTVNQIISIKPDLAIIKSDATVLKRSGGAVTLDTKDGLIVPGNLLQYTEKNKNKYAYTIRQNDRGQFQTTIKQIPYMTQKSINGGGLVKDVGQIQADLIFEQDHIKGTITNKSIFDYQELYLTMGNRRMELGSLAKGETKQINEEIKPFYKQDFSLEDMAYPTQNERQKAMLYDNSLQAMGSVNGMNLVGVSNSPYQVFTASEQGFVQDYLTFVQQPILLKDAQTNRITYPYGTLGVQILSTEGNVSREDHDEVTMYNGKVTYGLQVPSNVELTNVMAPLDNFAYQYVKKAVYHAASREWKVLDSNSALQLKDNPKEYVNTEGFILIRFIYEGDSPVSIPQPVFQLEGKEKQ
ncbi:hypothetical protein [Brevibacillus laterosporus]|uniref:hypothetical protein n=1 Tax=Brevibacillus laterosporus TaxID=1465 RepID=UPI000E6B5C30|nr:hypothetical protein [Brevibacillus laterosporus]AYB37713.1 hypothetical protein D5F52_05115 [Brevibacillus laterosporus]MBM7108321.1 hypothetical protein [Brevibacillus laterosporus]